MAHWAWRSLVGKTEYSRAERHLRSSRIELDAAKQARETEAWVTAATALLTEAETALHSGKVDACWHFINAARRQIASGQDDQARSMAARVLRIESEKLSRWRRKSLEAVLEDDVPSPAALQEAHWLRDDHYENRYHRIAMQREQLGRLVKAGSIALLAILIVSATAPTPITQLLPDQPWHWRMLVVVLAFGVLGASFGAARTITVKDLRTVIPELALSKWITQTRALLGATLGLAAYTFLQSGLLNQDALRFANAAAAAFIGGFSEQLIVKVIGDFGTRKDDSDK
jgi:hypothetical protein